MVSPMFAGVLAMCSLANLARAQDDGSPLRGDHLLAKNESETGAGAPPAVSAALLKGGRIRSRYDGKCMDRAAAWTSLGRVIVWECNDGENQGWIQDDGEIRLLESGGCLDYKIDGWFGYGNREVRVWDCNGDDNQHWEWRDDELVSKYDGSCLTYNLADAKVYAEVCDGGANQKWYLD
eukprot:TRINITY_DN18087_c1_g2_i1.p1 TRINITY_DN18087_c1_g2~~TRINITY_DN18087_c1_g2_i1.p1  ORF type:complete len:199 (-),score=47.24 TRINITY_DN18087_c1_g2_i1:216-752(-)